MSTASKFGLRGLVLAGLVFGAGTVQAALQPYTSAGANLVYSTGQDLTWTADANLFKTQCDAEGASNCPNLVDAIITAGSPVTDSLGSHPVQPAEFDQTTGRMTWWAAQAWVAYLNDIAYGGATNWRLWEADPEDTNCSIAFDPGGGFPTQYSGYGCIGSELGYLYYEEGGATPRDSLGPPISTLSNLDVFDNLNDMNYLSSTEYAPNRVYAWLIQAAAGDQGLANKAQQYFAWPVRPGQVAPAIDCFATVDYLGNTNDRIRLTHPSDSPTMGPTTSVPHEVIVSVLAPDGTVRGAPITLEFAERKTEVRTMKQIFDAAGLNIYDGQARGNIIQLAVPTGFLVSGTVQQGSQIVPLIFRCHMTPPEA